MTTISRARGALECVLLLLAVTGSASAQTFQVHIQARPSTSLPTGQVKITLETSGSVAGAHLSITTSTNYTGTATVPGVVSWTCATSCPPSPDTAFAVPQADNPNNVVILYQTTGEMASAGNFCVLAGGQTGDETVTMTFSGLPSVTGYRMNSYVAASTLDCNQAYVRIESDAAQFITAPPGTDNGRNPLDIILVLDNSGSMALPPPGVTPVPPAPYNTRYGVLSDVVDQFLNLWETVSGPPVSADPSDRIGLVFYSTAAEPASFPPNGIFVPRGSGSNPWTPVISAVQANGPTNLTAIGQGLIEAINDATTGPNKSTNDVEIVLMTDGLQNVSPLLQVDPAPPNVVSLNFGTPGTEAGCTTEPIALYCAHMPIETVAFGIPGAVEGDLLSYISLQTAGYHSLTRTLSETATAFTDSLVQALKGNTVSLHSRVVDTLAVNTGSSAAVPLYLDGSVKRATFVLGWENQRGALDLQITAPGCTPTPAKGCPTVTPVKRVDRAFWTMQSIDIPASGPTGAWTVSVVRRQYGTTEVAAAGSPAIPYYFSAYTVEGKLGYRLAFPPAAPGTGDAITLTAEVSYQGKPLTGLGDGIKVQIERPNTGLGTILHNTSVPENVLTTEPDPSDKTTPYERKIIYLAGTTGLVTSVTPRPIPTAYVLRDDGHTAQDGDAKANDGTYTARFADTSSPGLYRFHVTLDWDNPTTGKIHREETLEQEVKVNSDPAASQVTLVRGASAGQWTLNVTPVDKFGNFVGPGVPDWVKVTMQGPGTVGAAGDALQTGNYSVPLAGVPPGADPNVTINIGGKQIRSGPLSTVCHPNPAPRCFGHGTPCTAFILIGGVFAIGFRSHRSENRKG